MIDRNFVALVKGAERYVIVYDDGQERFARCTLGLWASCTELSFSWYDASKLSAEIRTRQEAKALGR